MLIAITVSTNYYDILRIVIENNKRYFKRWIIVTDIKDISTIELAADNGLIVLYWNFQNNGRRFDKGGAVAFAQNFAYTNYPQGPYLLLDSDICLTHTFSAICENNGFIEDEAIYGASQRRDFGRLSDWRSNENFIEYAWGNQLQGYFQLYKKKAFYKPSFDASACDLAFLGEFERHYVLKGFGCDHLGRPGNWGGRSVGSDFLID